MDPLVQYYMQNVPQAQQVPGLAGRPNAADFIRQSRPDIARAYQSSLTPLTKPRGFSWTDPIPNQPTPPQPSQGSSRLDQHLAGFGGFEASLANDWLQTTRQFPGTSSPGDIAGLAPQAAAAGGSSRSPAEEAAIRGYLSGQTGRPRRPGDFSYSGPNSDFDFSTIFGPGAAGGVGGGGPRVPTNLFQLSETPEERAMLERELAHIEAMRSAGDVALRAGWGSVQSANAAAAAKARAMGAERGDVAAGYWERAAEQARTLAAQRAAAAGQFEGRAAIDVSPEAGVADWAGFMESQAPAERRMAERQQEILGSDLDWMAGMAGQQGEAYAADLQRLSMTMSFERAREHNLRVQERIGGERMALANMQFQASAAGQGQRSDPFTDYAQTVGLAASVGNPNVLVQKYGMTPRQAQQAIDSYWSSLTRERNI